MGTSWLTTVKKVFRSPSKTSPKKSCKRRDERRPDDDEEQHKKTEKRRWTFRKTTSNNHEYEAHMSCNNDKKRDSISICEKRVEIASIEVNKTVAKVAVRVKEMVPAYLAREYYAALIIQTAFRGYLARRALNALKGIVKLQALVRGHNIRKQAKTTLKCMQTLIRVQAKLRDQSLPRHSHGQTRKSMYAESNNLWDKYKDIHHRKPMYEEESNIEDQCKAYSYTIEDIEALLQSKKEASLHREQALAYALSQQIRRLDRKIYPKEENNDESEWLGQWLESKEYREIDSRVMTNRTESIKDVDMDSLQSNLRTPINLRQSHQHQDPPNRRHSLHAQPLTPTLREVRSIQTQSASPRCVKGYRSHSAATTPSLRHRPTSTTANTPNYMAATESAKAKARTQSTPRQRHSTSSDRSERSGSVRKRLSFPALNEPPRYEGSIYDNYSCFSQNLRSPSFRSVQEGLYYLERGTTCSSYTDITGGEFSPASTSQLRRWLS